MTFKDNIHCNFYQVKIKNVGFKAFTKSGILSYETK